MQTRQRPLAVRLLAVAGLMLGASVGAVTAASPATATACTSSTGVTVVVDYGSLGGTSVGCATTLGSGIDVLEAAGHTATYLPRQPGMVCRIDSLPDPCNGAPVTAYWSYWQASPGGSWSYSTVGATSTHPKNGTVQGWAFGAGKPPAMRPPAVSRPKTTSTSRPSSRTTTSRPTTTVTSGAAGGGPRTTGPAGTSTQGKASSTTATAPSGTPTPTSLGAGTTEVPATRTDAAAPTSATTPSAGARSLVAAGLLVLMLAGGGGVIAWRRRGSGA